LQSKFKSVYYLEPIILAEKSSPMSKSSVFERRKKKQKIKKLSQKRNQRSTNHLLNEMDLKKNLMIILLTFLKSS